MALVVLLLLAAREFLALFRVLLFIMVAVVVVAPEIRVVLAVALEGMVVAELVDTVQMSTTVSLAGRQLMGWTEPLIVVAVVVVVAILMVTAGVVTVARVAPVLS
jgi:hypothetical protein